MRCETGADPINPSNGFWANNHRWSFLVPPDHLGRAEGRLVSKGPEDFFQNSIESLTEYGNEMYAHR
ncbi:hypothetical protein TNCV_4642711 [Trichonephila clavipes]|nr:hypothetical protein TNCV_4642711 [Trichonephila clavipes]